MNKEIKCTDCGKVFEGGSSHFGGGISPQEQFNSHKKACEQKQQLLNDIVICKTQAKISECLNCKRYQKECSGTNQR